MTLAMLLDNYATLVEKGSADRDLDEYERSDLAALLRRVAKTNPPTTWKARRTAVAESDFLDIGWNVVVRATDVIRNIQ